jgi:hypothetical protein
VNWSFTAGLKPIFAYQKELANLIRMQEELNANVLISSNRDFFSD